MAGLPRAHTRLEHLPEPRDGPRVSTHQRIPTACRGGPSRKRDAGIELRLEAFSFYAYPTRISIAGAYGFDKFTRNIQGVAVTYGKEWRFYLGVLFDFDISEMGRLGRMNGGVRGDGR